MNNEATVKCPSCGQEFQLTDALAGPLLAATKKQMQAQIDAAENIARAAKLDADIAKADIERDIEFRVAEETERVRAVAVVEAANASAKQVGDLRTKLAAAQQAQADALRKGRELEDKERELDLTIETRVAAEVNRAAAKAELIVDDRYKLKLLEKDTLLESMTKKIEELKQKAEQGSQQMQGEVQELDLQAKLATAFPFDQVGDVAKGVRGADVTQRVVAPSGADCGLILYESKRTKTFSAGWLPKLREDGRKAQADVLVLVTQALPEEVETFNQIDNVWVCSSSVALPLASALRATLLAVHATKQAQDGMRTRSEEVYAYVTGSQFRRRVEALVEVFTTMQDDLSKEQRAVQRLWAARAAQLDRMAATTGGLFGDLQGIAGAALSVPSGLALPGGEE
jgi:hypothetical protein